MNLERLDNLVFFLYKQIEYYFRFIKEITFQPRKFFIKIRKLKKFNSGLFFLANIMSLLLLSLVINTSRLSKDSYMVNIVFTSMELDRLLDYASFFSGVLVLFFYN